jgi:hypothetical protein
MPDSDVEEVVREALQAAPRGARPDDLWGDVQRRIRRRALRRRALVGVAAVVVAAAGVGSLAVTAGDEGERAETRVIDAGAGPATTVAPPMGEAEPEWIEIAPPTIDARQGASITPAGDKVLLWGGSPRGEGPYGMVYYPPSASWAALADAPIEARAEHVAVWTGTESIVWGGQLSEGVWVTDGAAYDPSTGQWRTIAPSPLPPDRYAAVWTGSEMVVVGGGEATVTGAAYDPATDSWRMITPPPVALVRYQLVWSGQWVLAVGGERTGEAAHQQFRALAYNPVTDAWLDMGGQAIGSNEVAVAVADGQLVVWSNRGDDTWRFDLATGAWSSGAPPPATCEGADRAVGIPGAVIGMICGVPYRYDLATDAWTELDWPDDLWIVAGDHVFVP